MSVVVRGADFALTRYLRSLGLAASAALATKSALDAELEALKAFGAPKYSARVVQVLLPLPTLPRAKRHCV